MSNPVVLITGALAGIGRATAFAFAADKANLVVSGATRRPARRWSPSLGPAAAKPSSSAPMSVRKRTSAT